MKSVLPDTGADAIASAAVAVSGAVNYFTGRFFWLDCALAADIGILIGTGALQLLRGAVRALRSGSPLDLRDPS